MGMIVSVSTQQLLGILHTNLEAHVQNFNEAYGAYRKKVEDKLRQLLREVENSEGRVPSLSDLRSLMKPECFQSEYNRAIEMLEMHQGDTLNLDADTYQKFVQDEWNWTHLFKGTYASNTGKSL